VISRLLEMEALETPRANKIALPAGAAMVID
jgi:hypothetical protein